MNRAEFMEKLRELLNCLPENEREEAIEFYEGYFDDAGQENEQEVIKALGYPEKVAKTIIDGYRDEHGEEGEFTENGFSGYGDVSKDEVGHRQTKKEERKINLGNGGLILVLIVAVFALPVLGPILAGIGSVLIGIVAAAAALLFAAILVGVGLIIAGIAAMLATFGLVLVTPGTAMLTFGIGLLLVGLGILLVILGIWIVCKAGPSLIRWIVTLIRRIFGRKEK